MFKSKPFPAALSVGILPMTLRTAVGVDDTHYHRLDNALPVQTFSQERCLGG